jgi:hypothetical protein
LEIGEQACPQILGKDVSTLRRAADKSLAARYIERARLRAARDGRPIEAIDLLDADLRERRLDSQVAESREDAVHTRREIRKLIEARSELSLSLSTENQAIFRDFRRDWGLPTIDAGVDYREVELRSDRRLRLKVLHPDALEHVTGADPVYEIYDDDRSTVRVAAVQYKLWREKRLSTSEERLCKQLEKMRERFCESGHCGQGEPIEGYRFPHCAAFLRPTDKLQSPDSKLCTNGEHLPICQIPKVELLGRNGSRKITRESISKTSVPQMTFEEMFSNHRLGSKELSKKDLPSLYGKIVDDSHNGRVIIHAQQMEDDAL